MITHSDLARAATVAREVDLTTFGRETGRPSRRTIWITTDALGRIHIRSGQGLAREWPSELAGQSTCSTAKAPAAETLGDCA